MQARGIFLTVLSAVLYGLNPLFSKTINVGGCNSLTQTFARLAAGIPSAVTNTVLLCLGIDALWSTGVLLRWGDIDLLAPSRLRRKHRTV